MRFPLIFFVAIFLSLPTLATESQTLAVVVAKDVAARNFTQGEVVLIYKKKLTMWESGQRIHPVNLPLDHSVRKQFSLAILKSLPETQSNYWNDMYYHGVSPPYVLSSFEAVLRFVAETKGAIAYLPACLVNEHVQPVLWIDENLTVLQSKPDLNCQ